MWGAKKTETKTKVEEKPQENALTKNRNAVVPHWVIAMCVERASGPIPWRPKKEWQDLMLRVS